MSNIFSPGLFSTKKYFSTKVSCSPSMSSKTRRETKKLLSLNQEHQGTINLVDSVKQIFGAATDPWGFGEAIFGSTILILEVEKRG